MGRRVLGLGAAGAAAVLVTLGLSTPGEPSAREVAADYAEAYFAGELVEACELWSPAYRAELLPAYAADGDHPPGDCVELGEQQGDAAEAWPDEGFAMRVDAPRISGPVAVVALQARGGGAEAPWEQAMEVELVQEGGAWHVAGFRPPGAGRTGG